jgi:DNA mismatch repair protein MSH6
LIFGLPSSLQADTKWVRSNKPKPPSGKLSILDSPQKLMSRMEIRQKDAGNKGREIVRRELGRVFTNGTIVDGHYLSTHDANHCVSIKELSPGPNEPSTFGVCIVDASTGEFQLSYFQDDIIRSRLDTLFSQIRPKELICAKVSCECLV